MPKSVYEDEVRAAGANVEAVKADAAAKGYTWVPSAVAAPSSEMISAQGVGTPQYQQGLFNLGAGAPRPNEGLQLTQDAIAGLSTGAGMALGNIPGGFVGGLVGEGLNTALAYGVGHPEMSPINLSNPTTSQVLGVVGRPALGVLPSAILTGAGRFGASTVEIPPATAKATSQRALGSPFSRKPVMDLTRGPLPEGAEANLGNAAIASAKSESGTLSEALDPRNRMLSDLDQHSPLLPGSDMVDALMEYAKKNPILGSNQNVLKELEDTANNVIYGNPKLGIPPSVDSSGNITYTRWREITSELQGAAFDKDSSNALRKVLRSVQHDLNDHMEAAILQNRGQSGLDAYRALNTEIGQREGAIKGFSNKIMGTSQLPVNQQVKAENFVRNYGTAPESLRRMVQEYDAATGNNFDQRMMDLAIKRDWNPSDKVEAREIGLRITYAISRVPVLNPRLLSSRAIELSGVAGPATAPLVNLFLGPQPSEKP